jgi:predicted MFS family arabinose efflux permease
MATTFCFGVGFGAYFQYLPLLAERRDISPIGPVYVAYGVAIIVTRLLSGRFIDGADRRTVLLPATVVTVVGMILFALADSLPLLMLAAACTASGGGLSHPALIAIHVDRVAERGKATAAFYLAFDVGIGIGSWLLAAVLHYAGISMLYVAAAAASALALIALRRIRPIAPLLSENT